MYNTRSQTAKNIPTSMNGRGRYSDAEGEGSVPDVSKKRTDERI